jgi:DNA-entry nuclease
MKLKYIPLTFLLILLSGIYGCTDKLGDFTSGLPVQQYGATSNTEIEDSTGVENDIGTEDTATSQGSSEEDTDASVSLNSIPEYSGKAYVTLLGNQPEFSDADKQITEAFEFYSDLDALGRCGQAYANICPELQPTEERGEIGQVKPSGWHMVKYNDLIEGNYLFNRCHLIGYQLAGENANEKNLITGTRYLNTVGMLPFENKVDDYVDATGNHVLYRVTPVFEGDNLVASGVQMEAWSVEDQGSGICFNIYCYNVQPGIRIDYATGDSWEDATVPGEEITEENTKSGEENSQNNTEENAKSGDADHNTAVQKSEVDNGEQVAESEVLDFVLNKNTKKFHLPDCSSVNDMAENNKVSCSSTVEEMKEQGYSPCQRCLSGYGE